MAGDSLIEEDSGEALDPQNIQLNQINVQDFRIPIPTEGPPLPRLTDQIDEFDESEDL